MLVFRRQSTLIAAAIADRIRKRIPGMRQQTLRAVENVLRSFHSQYERLAATSLLNPDQFRPQLIDLNEAVAHGDAIGLKHFAELAEWANHKKTKSG